MKSETVISFGVFIFLCTLKSGYSTECYTCNTTFLTPTDKDLCKGLETLTKCQDPALCLTATYLYEDINANIKRYTTIKTCNALMNGQECEFFLKNLRVMSPQSAKIEYYGNKCSTCRGDKEACNGASTTSIVLPSTLVLILSYIFCKLA